MAVIHPLLNKIAAQPGVFVEHAGAYAWLAAVEARELGRAWQRRALWLALALLFTLVALTLTGMALLLAAALPTAEMPAPFVLIWLPLCAWAAAIGCAGLARHAATTGAFAHLRSQWSADLDLLRQWQAERAS